MSDQDKPLKPQPVAASAVRGHVYKVFPQDMNAHRAVFGGLVMSTIDRLALVVAERHSRRVCVTAAVDAIHFLAPAKDGDTLIYSAACNRAWTTSMEIGAKVVAENSYTGETRHIVSAYLTFVALDADNKPVAVPPLQAETPLEEQRYREAQARRELRLEHAEKLRALRREMQADQGPA